MKISISDIIQAQRKPAAEIKIPLALMGFGFVLARFSIFIRETTNSNPAQFLETPGFSLYVGISLITIGASICFLSGWFYASQMKRLKEGKEIPIKAWPMERIIALTLAILGVFMAGYLLSLRT